MVHPVHDIPDDWEDAAAEGILLLVRMGARRRASWLHAARGYAGS